MKKIAVEEHVGFTEFADVVKEENLLLNFPNLQDPDRQKTVLRPLLNAPFAEDRIPTMDTNEVDMQVLCLNGSVVQSDPNADRAIRNAAYINEKLWRYTQEYSGRFLAMGTLPMQDPSAALKELDKCISEYRFVGIMLHGATNFHYYDEPQYECIWERLEESGLPLYLHPANPSADQIRIYDGYPELLGHTWNWNVYTATHALRIIFSGVFDRHPNAKLILGHMGEGLPYFLGRLDEGYEHRKVSTMGKMRREPSYYIKNNVYVTTSGGWGTEALHCAIEAVGVEHVLYACDYPHFPMKTSIAQLQKAHLTEREYEMIYYRNAERLFDR